MDLDQIIVNEFASQILAELRSGNGTGSSVPVEAVTFAPWAAETSQQTSALVPVGISNRHVHLSRSDMDTLFGPGSSLTRLKAVKQPGQFAAKETVTLRTPKGELAKVRILGPLRSETQIELSIADSFKLGLTPPIRMSGDLEASPGIEIIGPCGSVTKENGVIIAWRHIHADPATATLMGIRDGQKVDVEIQGDRGGILSNVVMRVVEDSIPEMHVDIEEANAFNLHNSDLVKVLLP
ncbi:MAG: phosphate propanoyltransferase [Desulfovibrio sp.]|uniref:phosphate propanoyltransferase n=1 Tax=Desulfovibrio sp. 7SRBS1 TaxID=3378064 RepID=UPI003B3E8BE3